MDDVLRQLVGFADHWIRQPGEKETMWILTQNHEQGLDLVLRIVRERLGDFQEVNIPEDSLPAFPGYNWDSGRAIFVLSQPNHIPTVQVTMQGTLAELRERSASQGEAYAMLERARKELGADAVVSAKPLTLSVEKQRLTPKVPDVLVVDQTYPMWEDLVEFITPETQVHLTRRVQEGPPMKKNDEAPDLARSMSRYNPKPD